MAFQRVYDLEQADKLWEVGLLWYRYTDCEEFEVDTSAARQEGSEHDWRPSADHRREGRKYQYAILVED